MRVNPFEGEREREAMRGAVERRDIAKLAMKLVYALVIFPATFAVVNATAH